MNQLISDDELRDRYSLRDNRDWKLSVARKQLIKDISWEDSIVQCNYRPFDLRWCYYIGSAEGHEYPNLQVGDEVDPRLSFALTHIDQPLLLLK